MDASRAEVELEKSGESHLIFRGMGRSLVISVLYVAPWAKESWGNQQSMASAACEWKESAFIGNTRLDVFGRLLWEVTDLI